ncbi:MAG: YccF domain-containing protein [Armatimonadetes bacterium]|nr:YccF domain-containing protein [Armatimonadota bacterium]
MSLLGNIVWWIFGGLIAGLGYMLGGALLCVTIVGIPFGMQAIKLGQATLMPFGKTVVASQTGSGCLATFFNILWLVLFGWGIATAHLASALALAVTIVGIPLALQHVKLIPVALLPFAYNLE